MSQFTPKQPTYRWCSHQSGGASALAWPPGGRPPSPRTAPPHPSSGRTEAKTKGRQRGHWRLVGLRACAVPQCKMGDVLRCSITTAKYHPHHPICWHLQHFTIITFCQHRCVCARTGGRNRAGVCQPAERSAACSCPGHTGGATPSRCGFRPTQLEHCRLLNSFPALQEGKMRTWAPITRLGCTKQRRGKGGGGDQQAQPTSPGLPCQAAAQPPSVTNKLLPTRALC